MRRYRSSRDQVEHCEQYKPFKILILLVCGASSHMDPKSMYNVGATMPNEGDFFPSGGG